MPFKVILLMFSFHILTIRSSKIRCEPLQCEIYTMHTQNKNGEHFESRQERERGRKYLKKYVNNSVYSVQAPSLYLHASNDLESHRRHHVSHSISSYLLIVSFFVPEVHLTWLPFSRIHFFRRTSASYRIPFERNFWFISSVIWCLCSRKISL